MGRLGLGIAFASALAACVASSDHAGPAPASSADDSLAPLRAFESERRQHTDFASLETSETAGGPDPYAIRALPGGAGFVGILRGRAALVVLDPSMAEVQRLPAPASPTALVVLPDGQVLVSGESASSLSRYRLRGAAHAPARLEPAEPLELAGVRAIRGLAAGPEGLLYVVEEHDDRLITVDLRKSGAPRVDQPACAGPLEVRRVGGYVLVDCLIEHAILARRVDGAGVPLQEGEVRLQNDGPFWSFEARVTPEGLLVAAGGVEDHPLDRTQGSFGYVDSFVYLFRIGGASASRLAAVNVSSVGVITPKALVLGELTASGLEVTVTGYGGDRMATLAWSADLGAEPRVSARDLPPGTSSVVALPDGAFAVANPLLDVWAVAASSGAWTPTRVPDSGHARSPAARLGEVLFFTSRMAPWNRSDGQLSRFTCETCHFEGYVDGRTHHTGRGDVHATTKPLLGLFNNRPHFSRALDPDLTTVAHNEFRVAGALSDHDPWFSLDPAEVPWLAELGLPPGAISPVELRRDLMTFLMEFTHRPNPSVAGRSRWTAEERTGAEVFRDRCEGCHAARLASDEPASAVQFERWESLVMSPAGPLVWGRAEYKKTGVVPYVHPEGARVPSLRRLYKKRPYFTNGSAKRLADVLARARWAPDGMFFHDAAPDATQELDAISRAALLAFLDLL